MLNEYAPEQQMEEDAKAISEGARALADATVSLQKCLHVIPMVAEQLNRATTLKISDESKVCIIQAGLEVGKQTAEAFKKNVEPVIRQARREVKHVSIPATAAYCLLAMFIFLIIFVVLILLGNWRLWEQEEIWRLGGGLLIGSVAINSMILYVCHKGWM